MEENTCIRNWICVSRVFIPNPSKRRKEEDNYNDKLDNFDNNDQFVIILSV